MADKCALLMQYCAAMMLAAIASGEIANCSTTLQCSDVPAAQKASSLLQVDFKTPASKTLDNSAKDDDKSKANHTQSSPVDNSLRRVFLDLGANWANTLRLYEDFESNLGSDKFNLPSSGPWEVYAFEASPLIQPYLEEFVAYLNGEEDSPPPVTVPPSGSSAHLFDLAERYGCPNSTFPSTRCCMYAVFKEPLHQLKPDPKLNDTDLIQKRLDSALTPALDHFRYVSVPAAAGAEDGWIHFKRMAPEDLIRGGATNAGTSTVSDSCDGVDYAPPIENVAVPIVNVPEFITRSFKSEDFVVAKMDIEGSEFDIFNSLIDSQKLCLIDVLAIECHSHAGDCRELLKSLEDAKDEQGKPCISILKETKDYTFWDHYSTPEKYYPIDPRK